MKCPRCGTCIKRWRLLECTGHVDNPEQEPDEDGEDSVDWRDYKTVACRSGQCPKCFAYCSQILDRGALSSKYAVKITMGDLKFYVDI